MTNLLNYTHFPVYSVMVLFLGAFLIVALGGNKTVRNFIAFMATGISFLCMAALVKPDDGWRDYCLLDGQPRHRRRLCHRYRP